MAPKASNVLTGIFSVAVLGAVAYGAGAAMGYVAYELTHLPERSAVDAVMEGVHRADDNMARQGRVAVPDRNYRAFQG
jgi:hypothetical protein